MRFFLCILGLIVGFYMGAWVGANLGGDIVVQTMSFDSPDQVSTYTQYALFVGLGGGALIGALVGWILGRIFFPTKIHTF